MVPSGPLTRVRGSEGVPSGNGPLGTHASCRSESRAQFTTQVPPQPSESPGALPAQEQVRGTSPALDM